MKDILHSLERSTVLYTIGLDIKYAICNHSLANQLLDKQEILMTLALVSPRQGLVPLGSLLLERAK